MTRDTCISPYAKSQEKEELVSVTNGENQEEACWMEISSCPTYSTCSLYRRQIIKNFPREDNDDDLKTSNEKVGQNIYNPKKGSYKYFSRLVTSELLILSQAWSQCWVILIHLEKKKFFLKQVVCFGFEDLFHGLDISLLVYTT